MRAAVLVAALIVLGAAPVKPVARPAPTSRPDFSGRWQLDVKRTDWGTAKTLPRARVDVIQHRDPVFSIESMTVRSNGDTVRFPWRYTTDGSETQNKMMGQDVTSIGQWRGDTLAFESSAQVMLAEFRVEERWWLSADRKELTIRRHNDSPMGKSDQRYVFVRKP